MGRVFLRGDINRSLCVGLLFATVMLARLLTSIGAPGILNFLHFALLPAMIVFFVPKVSTDYIKKLVFLLFVFFGIIVVSAVINSAGLLNVVLDSLLLCEPFLFLLLIVSTSWSDIGLRIFKFAVYFVFIIHVAFSFFQKLFLGLNGDNIKGIFLSMGAGHHVAGALSLTFAVYFITRKTTRDKLLKIVVLSLAFCVVVFSDSKQVVAVFILALFALSMLNYRKVKDFAVIIFITILISLVVLAFAITIFPELSVWARPNLLFAGLEQKLSVFGIISSFYRSDLSWLFGLGPGHTISRLGWLLPEYSSLLYPMGATTSQVSAAVLWANQNHWISNSRTGSSMFSLMFSWAGIWGDLGFLGLFSYLGLWFVIWKNICIDIMSKYLVLTVLIFGWVFAWIEEPNYIVFVVSLIGIRFQEITFTERASLEKEVI